MKKVIVISLGGSQIFLNNEINVVFLRKFKSIIDKYKYKYNFIIVTGGGFIARLYISGLKDKNEKLQSFAGISVTRTNARFVSYFFNRDSEGVPHTMREVKDLVKKQNPVFCGALEYHPDQTSDGTSSQIARELGAELINLTNVNGLFDSDPRKNKNAKLIREISWRDFYNTAAKISFKPGQHFVLDQKAAKIIMDSKIKTYILGNDLRNLESVSVNKKFKGTLIFG